LFFCEFTFSDIPVTETKTDAEMIDISKTHTETNAENTNTDRYRNDHEKTLLKL